MHPSHEIEREYAARVGGEASEDILKKLKDGVMLEDGKAHFDDIVDVGGQGKNHWYHVVLKEGRNREVRRLWKAVNMSVSRLIRVRYGDIVLPRNLRRGSTTELSFDEVKQLLSSVGLRKEPAHYTDSDYVKRAAKNEGRPTGSTRSSARSSAKSPIRVASKKRSVKKRVFKKT